MPACKECIYEILCMDRLSKQGYSNYAKRNLIVEDCEHFRNKADYKEFKHGSWLVNIYNNKKFITCTACNSVIDCSYINVDENEFDYCPYCGDKLDGKINKSISSIDDYNFDVGV